jgi:hypothetical protein
VNTHIQPKRDRFRHGFESQELLARPWRLVGLLACLLCITGCRGCNVFNPIDDADTKKKEKVTDRFDVGSLLALPSSSNANELFLKPGHWCDLRQQVRANLADESLMISCSGVERKVPFRPLSILGLRMPIEFDRSASLARGQGKQLGYELFLPPTVADLEDDFVKGKAAIRVSFFPRTFGAMLREEIYPVQLMDNYQNFLVVLSQSADRYQFLSGLSCMTWPSLDRGEDERINPFRVMNITESEAQDSLPSRFATMMSVSHLFWNDCSGSAISETQQQAVLDWLHFGGQIVINGPEAQAGLKDSFLAPYLPLKSLRPTTSTEEVWTTMSQQWSIARFGEKEIRQIALPRNREIPTVAGELAEDASWVEGCEQFVAERSVANGRVVMTTFPIGEEALIRWPSYGSFVNSALLRRPHREWFRGSGIHAGTETSGDLRFAGSFRGQEKNPVVQNRVRVLGRDLGKLSSAITHAASMKGDADPPRSRNRAAIRNPQLPNESSNLQFRSDAGQLDNQALIVKAAFGGLQLDSGINVPRVSTILKLLLGYFIVLVPVNWLVFRLLGRVEFAWLAIPVIAVIGAVVVARTVQLDVGFSRSQNVFNLVEIHSGYHRGHVSSFLSLYTSLSTNYSVRSPDSSGIWLPYVSVNSSEPLKRESAKLRYEYGAQAGAGLAGYPVRSNSTSFIRGESMCDLGGEFSIEWKDEDAGSIQFRNNSTSELKDVILFGKTEAGTLFTGSIDQFPPHSYREMDLKPNDELSKSLWESPLPEAASIEEFDETSPGRLSELGETGFGLPNQPRIVAMVTQQILKRHHFQPGELMVLGWNQDDLSGMAVSPRASQIASKSLVVIRTQKPHSVTAAADQHLPPKLSLETPPEPSAPNP